MWPFELMRPDVDSCPECGCEDVEHIGRHGRNHRYACLEGHQFELPRPKGPLGRWLHRRNGDEAAQHVEGEVRSRQ